MVSLFFLIYQMKNRGSTKGFGMYSLFSPQLLFPFENSRGYSSAPFALTFEEKNVTKREKECCRERKRQREKQRKPFFLVVCDKRERESLS